MCMHISSYLYPGHTIDREIIMCNYNCAWTDNNIIEFRALEHTACVATSYGTYMQLTSSIKI